MLRDFIKKQMKLNFAFFTWGPQIVLRGPEIEIWYIYLCNHLMLVVTHFNKGFVGFVSQFKDSERVNHWFGLFM